MTERDLPFYTENDVSRFPVFVWEAHYNIGIEQIDEEHRHLVGLINKLSAQLLRGHLTDEERQNYLREVVDYSHYHFADEERLMEASGLDAEFVIRHKQSHKQFVRQIELFMPELQHDPDEAMGMLLKFLFSWLIFHILGSDQAIHDQIVLIDQGLTPAEAAVRVGQAHDADQVGPLLQALGNFFDMLSSRSRDLRKMNASLEKRVEERTRELLQANETLLMLSQTDLLTDLPNRRHAMQSLNLLWVEAQNLDQSLCCLMIDADYFKEVNDLHGHKSGDRVLKALAVTLRDNVRSDDVIARLGGDEFCVLCPQTTLDGGMQLARQLLDKVIAMQMPEWRSSVSIGVACNLPTVQQSDELIRLADEGLYLAKAAGRTCIRSAQQV